MASTISFRAWTSLTAKALLVAQMALFLLTACGDEETEFAASRHDSALLRDGGPRDASGAGFDGGLLDAAVPLASSPPLEDNVTYVVLGEPDYSSEPLASADLPAVDELDAGAPTANSRLRAHTVQDIQPLADTDPDFDVEIRTCNASPAPVAGDKALLTIQVAGEARGWNLAMSRSPSSISRFAFRWPGATGMHALESLKVELQGSGSWCLSRISLRYYGANRVSIANPQLLWEWNSEVEQSASSTYLHGHSRTGVITLDNDSATARASFVRFTLPTSSFSVSAPANRCHGAARRGFCVKTCDTAAAATTDAAVAVKHDNLWDFLALAPSEANERNEQGTVSFDNFCAIRTLQALRISAPTTDPWSVCQVYYHDYTPILLSVRPDPSAAPSQVVFNVSTQSDSCSSAAGFSPLWTTSTTARTTSATTGQYTYSFDATVVDPGANSVVARQAFLLALDPRVKACLAGTNSSDANCNGIDDDCDGQVDEEYPNSATTCGVGACARTGIRSCVNGQVQNSCSPGAPASEACDTLDNDCDGAVNESLQRSTSCGVGICAFPLGQTCNASGAWLPACVPSTANAIPERSGNNLDDDCDGSVDEERTEVSCDDGHDNDGDGLVDCADRSDCSGRGTCRGGPGFGCNLDVDCESGLVCRLSAGMSGDGVCVPPSCENGRLDPGELRIDCGGDDCPVCDAEDECAAQCTPGETTDAPAKAVVSLTRGTFSRASAATYEDSQGRLLTAPSHELRFVSYDGRRMALIEGAGRNYIRQASQLGSLPWAASAGRQMELRSDAAVAPDQTATADLLTSRAGPSRSRQQNVFMPSSRATISMWLKSEAGRASRTRFTAVHARDESVGNTPEPSMAILQVHADWTRQDASLDRMGVSSDVLFSNDAAWPTVAATAVDAENFLVWGMQLEDGRFPTSYMPAAASDGSRAADRLTIPASEVPSWVDSSLWQMDVRPLYSHTEMAPGQRFTLLAWPTGSVSLTGLFGNVRLDVRFGNLTTHRTLTWKRGDTLTLSFDPQARRIAVSGAATGNGDMIVNGAMTFAGGFSVGSDWQSSTSHAFAAFSDLRRVDAVEQFCDAAQNACNALCPCGPGEGPAAGPNQCAPGLVARSDVAWRFGLPAGTTTCWDPACDGPLAGTACGSAQDRCGLCPIAEGCSSDAECGEGESCGHDNGWAFGLAGRVCWPNICQQESFRKALCGNHNELCGTCPTQDESPPVCVPDCTNKSCGSDGCGGSCGVCLRKDDDAIPTDVGAMEVDVSVTPDGNARVAIPVHALPARQGMGPSLKLSYNSTRGQSALGLGWGLDGLSKITRCAQPVPSPSGMGREVEWGYCLDEVRLTPYAQRRGVFEPRFGSSGLVDVTSYHPENDPSIRLEHAEGHDLTQSSLDAWVAQYRDGREATFYDLGIRHIDGRIESGAPSEGPAAIWFLTRMQDVFGNYYNVDYTVALERHERIPAVNDEGLGEEVFEVYPERIWFTGHSPSGLRPTRSVAFEYDQPLEPDPDGFNPEVTERFLSLGLDPISSGPPSSRTSHKPDGIMLRTSKLLTKVTLQLEDRKVMQYRLDYERAPESKRPRLTTVRQCAGATKSSICKPPVTLGWTDAQPLTRRGRFLLEDNFEEIVQADAAQRLFPADVDGDGISEIVFSDRGNLTTSIPPFPDGPFTIHIVRNLQGGQPEVIDTGLLGFNPAFGEVQIVDMNRDGRDDIMMLGNVVVNGERAVKLVTALSEYDADGYTYKRAQLTTDYTSRYTASDMLVDLNGDGAPEWVQCADLDRDGRHGTWHAAFADPSENFSYGTFRSLGFGCVSSNNLTGSRIPKWGNYQSGFGGFEYTPRVQSTGPLFIDFDGDGVPELVWKDGAESDNERADGVYKLAASDGRVGYERVASVPEELIATPERRGLYLTIDVNGDDRLDVLFMRPERDELERPEDQAVEPTSYVWVSINNGYTLLPPVLAFDLHADYAPDSKVPVIAFMNATSFDMNGDSRAELLMFDVLVDEVPNTTVGDIKAEWRSFAWQGKRFERFGEALGEVFTTNERNQWIAPVALNLSGMGGDFVLREHREWGAYRVFSRAFARRDLVERVNVGVQPERAISHLLSYSSTDDPAVYQYHHPVRDTYECSDDHFNGYGSACVRHKVVVSERVTKSQLGLHEHTRETYFYRNGRMDVLGRGFAGFDTREVTIPALGSKHVQWFDTFSRDDQTGAPLYEGLVTYESKFLYENGATTDDEFSPVPWREDVQRTMDLHIQRCEGAFCGATPKKVYLAWPRTTTRTVSEQRGSQWQTLDVIERTQDRDARGNVTSSTMTAGNEVFSETARYKAPDTWGARTWIVSRPETVALSSCIPVPGCVGVACLAGCKGRTTGYEYDSDGVLKFTRAEADTEYRYDAYGNITELIATGDTHQLAPSERHSKLDFSAPGETEFIFAWKATNAVGHETLRKHHPVFGGIVSETFDGLTTETKLDAFGRVDYSETPARGEKVDYDYLPGANYPKTTTTVAGGSVVETVYDSLGRLASESTVAMGGRKVHRKWSYYPDSGALRNVSLPYFDNEPMVIDEEYTYDALNRLSSISHADSSYKEIKYSGDMTRVVDERGFERDFYRKFGRVVRVVDPPVQGVRRETRYEYGQFGRLNKIIDNQGNETLVERDSMGRLLRTQAPGQFPTDYRYNDFGELDQMTRLDGVWSETLYRDALGRTVKRVDSQQRDSTYQWDTAAHGLGALEFTTSPDGVTETYVYDAAKRTNAVRTSLDNRTFSFEVTARDEFGRITDRELPNGPGGRHFDLHYTYDDDSGTLTKIERVLANGNRPALWTLSSENPNGTVQQEYFGNGAITKRTLEPTRLLLDTIETKRGSTTIQKLVHTFDEARNLTDRKDYTIASAPGGFRREHFVMDALGRIDEATLFNGNGSTVHRRDYDYDVLGNLTRHPGASGTYEGEELRYEDGLRPHLLTSVPGRLEQEELVYDLLGRLERKGDTHIAYNHDSLPVRVWDEEGERDVAFSYDAGGRLRRSQNVGATGTTTTYHGGREYELVVDSTRETHRYHVWSPSRAIATLEWWVDRDSVDTTKFLHEDHLGSVVATSDVSGTLELSSFDAFGKARTSDWTSNATPTLASFGFTSHSQSELGSFGLVRAGARIYDPDLARFYQPDPVISAPLDSQDLNLYTYVRNRPLVLTDPTGLVEQGNDDDDYGATAVVHGESHGSGGMSAANPQPEGPARTNSRKSARQAHKQPTPPPDVSTGGEGTDPEPENEEAKEALNEALMGLGYALGEAIAEAIIPGLALANAIETLGDSNASAIDRGLAVLDIAMTVMPVKAGAVAKAAMAIGGAATTVVGIVVRNRRAVERVAEVGQAVGRKAKKVAQTWKGPTDYSHIKPPKDVTRSTKPTPRQVREMKEANRLHNDGVLRSDSSGEVMVDSAKSTSGVTPPTNEVQVDHIEAVANGGTRATENLNLITRQENRDKWY